MRVKQGIVERRREEEMLVISDDDDHGSSSSVSGLLSSEPESSGKGSQNTKKTFSEAVEGGKKVFQYRT